MADYLVKHSHGYMRHFCHSPKNGIYLCTMTNAHITGYEVLMAEGQNDFDMLIDDDDVTHIVCQDSEGNIIYIKNENGVWEKYTLLKSKTSSSYPKNFRIFLTDNLINMIYAVDYKGKRLLSHHMLESSDVPVAIDFAAGDFACAKDEGGNIHLLYTNGNGVTGWRHFSWNTKQWGEFTAASDEKLKNPYVFSDDATYAVAVTADNRVIYLSQDGQKVLAEYGRNPVIIKNAGAIYAMWENPRDAKVYVKSIKDTEDEFSSPIEFMAERFVPVKLFGLAATSFEQCVNRHCYGYIKDNIVSLFLISNFFKVNKTPPQKPDKNDNTHLLALNAGLQRMDNVIAEIDFRLCMIEKTVKELNLSYGADLAALQRPQNQKAGQNNEDIAAQREDIPRGEQLTDTNLIPKQKNADSDDEKKDDENLETKQK